MIENPMLEQALYNAVKEFILKDGSAALWEASVQPILRQMAALGLATGSGAIGRLGLMVGGHLLTDAELIAAEAVGATALPVILRRMAIGAAASVRPSPPIVMAVTVGVSIIATTLAANAATREIDPDNKNAYKTYINKYMGYLVKTVSMKRNTDRFPPPMLYRQWLNRDTSGAWWQQ